MKLDKDFFSENIKTQNQCYYQKEKYTQKKPTQHISSYTNQ